MTATLFQDLFAVISFGAMAAFVAMLFRPEFRAAFERRCVPSASALDLGFVRIVVCATLLLYVLTEDLASQARFSPDWFSPPGFMRWFGRDWFDWLLSSETRLRAVTWLLVAALALALSGLGTRVTVPLAAVLYLLFAALLRGFGKEFHEGYLGFYVLAVLAFLPCGDAWSVDARWLRPLWRRRLRLPEAAADRSAAYGWGLYACYAAASVPYLQLGMSKLIEGGLFWFDGRSLRNYMLRDNLNLPEYAFDGALRFHDAPTILFTAVAFLALLVELTYVLVLVFPRLRRVLPLCVALLHLGILFGQNVRFLDATLIPAIFILPSRWRWRWMGREPLESSQVQRPDESGAIRGPSRVARVWTWLRGPYVPIGLVLAILLLNYTRYRRVVPWPWPVVSWNMYGPKAPTKRSVNYRRFVAYYENGQAAPISLGQAVDFLDKPYRSDHAVRRNLPAFLIRCLQEIRRKQGRQIVGLSYEKRTWRYGRLSLDEHLARESPRLSYRVMEIGAPAAELRRALSVGANLLANGGFDGFDKKTGTPRGWDLEGAWLGIGVGPATHQSAAMLSASPTAQSLSQKVVVPETLARSALDLRAQALVRSSAAGASLEIETTQPGAQPTTARATAAGDGAWHLIEVTQSLASARKAAVRVVLRNAGAADVYYDDVRLFATPAAR